MVLQKKIPLLESQTFRRCAFGLLFLAALIVRISLYRIITSDYTAFVSQWYDYIQAHGGFAAFKYNFYNYNPPYLYLLALATYIPVPKLIAIKTISVIFDGVLALFTYLLVRLKYQHSIAAIISALVLAFAPTIFINSSAWGQCDAIYTAFCLGSLYFLLKGRPGWACTFFGLAFAFKLQAIFFLPLLLVLLLKRMLPIKYLVVIPVIFILSLAPAFIAGRDAGSLLTIYGGQVTTGGVGGGVGQGLTRGTGQFPGGTGGTRSFPRGANGANGGVQFPGGSGGTGRFPEGANGANGGVQFPGRTGGTGQFGGGNSFSSSGLTYNAPSFYQWFPTSAPSYWKWLGILLAGGFVVIIGILAWKSKEQLTASIILKMTLAFAMVIPFLLPEMHERYFYLADVVSIVYAFYFPRSFYIAIVMQLCSLLSYAPYLLNREIVSLQIVAVALLIIAGIVVTDLVLALYPHLRNLLEQPSDETVVEKQDASLA